MNRLWQLFLIGIGWRVWPYANFYLKKRKWLGALLFLIIFFVAVTLLTGCSTIQGFLFPTDLTKDAKIAWKHDLRMNVNGVDYYGMALLPDAKKYVIKIYPPDDEIDRLLWETCHRAGHADKAVKNYFWPWKKDDKYFEYIYKPSKDEKKDACSIKFQAFAQRHKAMSFGYLAIPDSREEVILPATTYCSGDKKAPNGKDVCESAVGTMQRIEFNQPVFGKGENAAGCEKVKGEMPGKEFIIYPAKDECSYVFTANERHPNGERLRFIWEVYGWEEIPPPEKD